MSSSESLSSTADSQQAIDVPVQQRIIECAGEIFAERGYRDTTVRDIAAAANVNLAGISYHFGGKQQLYVATIEAARKSRFDYASFAAADVALSPADRLRSFIRVLLARLVDRSPRDWKSRLLARELTAPTDFCFEQIANWFRPIFDALLRMVEEVHGRPIAEPRRTLIGFSIVGQCLFYRVSAESMKLVVPPQQRSVLEENVQLNVLADHISEFTLGGLSRLAERSRP